MTSYVEYEKAVLQSLWHWADQHHRGELEGGKQQRSPVLMSSFASNSILVPPNNSKANDIRTAIPGSQRHKWFRSLKSSQALTQSVFGAIRAFDRLDLFQDVSAECGRAAFFEDHRDGSLVFEHEVRGLEEPRPTSVDVMFTGPQERVATECKFTEREFGVCSRTQLSPDNDQHCNGSYQVQSGRRNRCALTEIGIRYWEYLPHLFDWPSDRDHVPCPFGDVYQLARNALAATVTLDGTFKPSTGHVIVVYDARNPEFREDGEAERQWDIATAACRVPGLLRRLSWQRLMAALARAPELAYLVDDVERKYGLKPD